nr:Ty3/gypsy retrotransposon protein [Tanacetum cinerariifolium]
MIGNGFHLHCHGFCSNVPLNLKSTTFTISCFVLPIEGTDVVLGMQWLGSLGPILADFSIPQISFTHEGRTITLSVFCPIQQNPHDSTSPPPATSPPTAPPPATPPPATPEAETVLDQRNIEKNGITIPHVLVKWLGRDFSEATWENRDDIQLSGATATQDLVDKVDANEGGIDTNPTSARPTRVIRRPSRYES